ncbi:MAG: hypothetical protein M1419_02765, partial [Bacteroidetes bacterium]|nr:hypothetical protein [Bacteroidota bacterium]
AVYLIETKNDIIPYQGGKFYFTAGKTQRFGLSLPDLNSFRACKISFFNSFLLSSMALFLIISAISSCSNAENLSTDSRTSLNVCIINITFRINQFN